MGQGKTHQHTRRPLVSLGNLGLFRRCQDRRRSSLIVLLRMDVGFSLSPHPLVLGLSGRSFGHHSFKLPSLEVGFVRLRPLEDSAEQE